MRVFTAYRIVYQLSKGKEHLGDTYLYRIQAEDHARNVDSVSVNGRICDVKGWKVEPTRLIIPNKSITL